MYNVSFPFISQHRTTLDHLNYYFFPKPFTDEEIAQIIAYGDSLPKQRALVGGAEKSVESDYRKSEIAWIDQTQEASWIYDKITPLVQEANYQMWNYDLWGYQDSIQYTTYYDQGGHYDWHADVGPNMSNRKLSCVIQLSEPDEYEGGELQLNTGAGITTIPRQKGMTVMFSSFVLHRVTPVLSGTRKTLVVWMAGPQFR